MTAQIADTVTHLDTAFDLVGVNGSGLFNPEDHGIEARWVTSACWRGFHCTYSVTNQSLRLNQVFVGLDEDDRSAAERSEGPILFDRIPSRYLIHGHRWSEEDGDEYTWKSDDYRYDGLNELVLFSGGLLLADGFVDDLYVHMGFHPAWKYTTVLELVFANGILQQEFDRSDRMAEVRQKINDSSGDDSPARRPTRQEIYDFIDRSFDLTYGK